MRLAQMVRQARIQAPVVLIGVLLWSTSTHLHAQQTISTAVNGPILGNNNSITITATGSVTSSSPSGLALRAFAGNTITTLANSGAINGLIKSGTGGYGLLNDAATIGSITNSGAWDGDVAALRNTGTVTSLTNDATGQLRGTQSGSTAIDNRGLITTLINSGTFTGPTAITTSGTIGTLTNQSGGVIGLGTDAISVTAGGVISSLGNAGTINATKAITSDGTITSLVNSGLVNGVDYAMSGSGIVGTLTNSGTIHGTDYGVVYQGATVSGTLSNAAGASLAADNYDAVRIEARLGLLKNAGHIAGGTSPNYRSVAVAGTLDKLENTGLIDSAPRGVQTVTGGASIGTLTNSGTISGGDFGVHVGAGTTITSLDNLAGGTITTDLGLGSAVFNGGTIDTLSNAGSLAGLRGLQNTGTVKSILNTGSLANVHNDGTIGDWIGSTAISSTGGSASIGTLYNNGTVSGDVLIDGQNLDVYSSSSGAYLADGTITVSNGSLNLQYGNTILDSDVVVATALNNYATLTLEHEHSLTGAYLQGSSASLITTFQTDTDFGRINATGSATLAGLLNIADPNSSVTIGHTYTLLTFANSSGAFGTLAYQGTAMTDLGGGKWTDGTLVFQEVWSPTSLSLSVLAVPEPSTIVLGALGIAGAALLRSRRNRRRAAPRR